MRHKDNTWQRRHREQKRAKCGTRGMRLSEKQRILCESGLKSSRNLLAFPGIVTSDPPKIRLKVQFLVTTNQ